MKDQSILLSENMYLEQYNMKLSIDHNIMRNFLEDLKHPEGYGHAVSTEVRKEAARILKGLQCLS